jgi:hypothetical protein
MNRILRTFVTLPAFVIALIMVPTLLMSASFGSDTNFWGNLFSAGAGASVAYGQTSPLPTPTTGGTLPLPTPTTGGTVPMPTATATRRPPVVYPTATPHRPRPYPTARILPTATSTPAATPTQKVYINSIDLEKVIGDRLSSTIYAYTEDGWLYRSDDDGVVWTLVNTTPTVDDFVMNADNPDVLYGSNGIECEDGVGVNDNLIYKSVDGGLTWIEVPGSAGKLPLLSHQGDEDSLFAADCEMLFLTTDGGFSWIAKPDNSPDALWETYRVIDMVAASLVGNPTPDTPNWDQLFAGGVDAEGTGVVAFSNDLGDTWVRLTPNISPAPWSLTALTADPFVEGLVAFSEPRSVWFTENFGVNWQVTTKGLSNVLDRGISGAVFGLNDILYHSQTDTLYLATARGLYEKTPSSNTWEKVDDTDFDLVNITGMLYTETSPNQIWLNSDDGVYVYSVE